MALVESYKNGELNKLESTEYATPQWAFTYLMEIKMGKVFIGRSVNDKEMNHIRLSML